MQERFRWLHLSDIHCMYGNAQTNLQRELLEAIKKILPVDCIVITGDFFQHGKCSYEELREFLNLLYETCSISGKWDWQRGTPMTRLFFCPGNHDLNRGAILRFQGREQNAEEYTRKEVLKEQANIATGQITGAPKGRRQNGSTSYRLLTNESFWQFNHTVMDLVGLPDLENQYKSECNVFTGSVETPDPVLFVGLNTELYAGQFRANDDIISDISTQWSEFKKAHLARDYTCAVKKYEKYAFHQNELVGEIACDDGNLCFISNEAQKYAKERIEDITQGRSPIVILFGHHPLNSLALEAQENLALFAKTNCCESKVYLCGHSHKPGCKQVEIRFTDGNPYTLTQICVGGSFADVTGYNSCSFMVGTIFWNHDCGQVKLSEDLFLWVKRFDSKIIEDYQDNIRNRPYAWAQISFKDYQLRYTTITERDAEFKKEEGKIFDSVKEIAKKDANIKNTSEKSVKEAIDITGGSPKPKGLYNSDKDF